VTVGAGQQHFFERFCALAGLAGLPRDLRFATISDRVGNNDALVEILSEATRRQSTDWWLRQLDELGIPCGPVLQHDQVFNHPQVLHRRMVQTVQHPKLGAVKTLGVPIKLSDTPGSIRTSAPMLGEHTDDIRKEFVFHASHASPDT
jgi:crotonobetainyl-CoA:carnitine CoA-transferase CaiB-like acyl-CoA transferase